MSALTWILLGLWGGCTDKGGGDTGAASAEDSGSADGGSADGGSTDGGTTDGGTTDGGTTDGGTTDGGTTDGGTTDGGGTDGGGTGGSTEPDWCASPAVTFQHADGTLEDLTQAMTEGDYTTLDSPGRLLVCPGTWFVRALLRADIEVIGLGATRGETVLSGGESGTILDIAGEGVVVSVENVTLDRGAGLDVDHNSGGGGIYCEDFASVFVRGADFTRSFANDGPALYARDCTVDIEDALFEDNYAEDDGGALTLWYSVGTLSGVTFRNNESLDGGAIASFYSTLSIADSTIEDNVSNRIAGGIWSQYSELSLVDVTLARNINSGPDQGGGALIDGSATLERVAFIDNSAPKGGGIFVYWEATVEGTDCDFSGNVTDDIHVADYSEELGYSIAAGEDYSFYCAETVCTER